MALLLDLRVLLGAALIATGIYAKVQTVRLGQKEAEFAQFRADVESEAAKSKVAAAQEAARQAQAAEEVLSDLQVRYVALNARYRVLRSGAGSGPVPALSHPPPGVGPIAIGPVESDADARCVAVIEEGDRELAKFRELWELQLRNSALSSGL